MTKEFKEMRELIILSKKVWGVTWSRIADESKISVNRAKQIYWLARDKMINGEYDTSLWRLATKKVHEKERVCQ